MRIGDTEFLPEEVVDRFKFREENQRVIDTSRPGEVVGGRPAPAWSTTPCGEDRGRRRGGRGDATRTRCSARNHPGYDEEARTMYTGGLPEDTGGDTFAE